MVEWLSSRLAEQGTRGSKQGLTTSSLEMGYHRFPVSRDMTEKLFYYY